MGASNFGTLQVAETAKAAYSRAVDQARAEHGSNPYNGTISTTEGFDLSESAPEYGSDEFSDWEMNQLERLKKWGKCRCVEVKGEAGAKIKKRFGETGVNDRVFYFFGWAAE